MATHSVDMVIKARDEASRKFNTVGGAAMSMGSMIKKAAIAAGAYLGVREISRFMQSSLQAYGESEKAASDLGAALSNLGKKAELPSMIKFAEQMQKMTTIEDDAIIASMKLGATIGNLSGSQLTDATKTAIGLAAAYNIDLDQAMQLTSMGAAGVTVRLKKLGIEMQKGATDQEVYAEIVKKGSAGFKLAEAQTGTYAGTILQLKNAYSDVKEEIGGALMPVFKEWAEKTKIWLEDNKTNIGIWA